MNNMNHSPSDRGPEGRILVLGLDGASLDFLEPLSKKGRLPNIARLMEEGCRTPLESTIPPVTIPAWVSMFTGKNPGKLGLYDLLRREGYSVKPNGGCFRGRNPIWRILNAHGYRVGVLNLPGTYPPEEMDGFMVTGMLTPSKSSPSSYPPDLASTLYRRIPGYELDVPQWAYSDEENFFDDLCRSTERRGEAAEYLIESIPCDLYIIVFTEPDRLQHVLWHRREKLEEYWALLDEVIGGLLDLFEDETIFVVSDHGFGPIKKTFYVNEWLKGKGLLKVERRLKKWLLAHLGRIMEGLYEKLGEVRLLHPLASLLKEALGVDRLWRYLYTYLSKERIGGIDWRRTKAFSCVHTPHFGQIYVNLKGRMEEGCVDEVDRPHIIDAIVEELRGLVDEDGTPLKVEAYRAWELYGGPHVEEAPDIVFLIEGGSYEVDAKIDVGRVFVDGASWTRWTGTHTKRGLLIGKGREIRRGYGFDGASIVDITPTLLHLFHIPIPEDVDGRVLEEIFL
jgi:predicted AlkP superfamily phosphohydrolase/phosphomutase